VVGVSVRVEGVRRTSFPSRRKTIVATAASSDGSPDSDISTFCYSARVDVREWEGRYWYVRQGESRR